MSQTTKNPKFPFANVNHKPTFSEQVAIKTRDNFRVVLEFSEEVMGQNNYVQYFNGIAGFWLLMMFLFSSIIIHWTIESKSIMKRKKDMSHESGSWCIANVPSSKLASMNHAPRWQWGFHCRLTSMNQRQIKGSAN